MKEGESPNTLDGGGISKDCEKAGGQRKLLTEHMKTVWSEINFTPTTFKLPEDTSDAEDGEDTNKEGDKPIVKARAPAVEQPEISQSAKENLTGFKINNLPKSTSEEEMVKFLKENVQKDLDIVNFQLNHTTRNNVEVGFFLKVSTQLTLWLLLTRRI